ncbi:MAG: nucleotide exchange factor GrpE [Candidatus Hydrogenedentota bacterium]
MSKHVSEKTALERRLEEELAKEAVDGALDADDVVAGEPADGSAADTAEDFIKLANELEGMKDQLLRTKADFDNYRKRVARDNERLRQTAAESVLRDILPVLDTLELALAHSGAGESSLAEGVAMVLNQLMTALERHGLKIIDPAGAPFDPRLHEAVAHIPHGEIESDKVAEVFQRGYALGDMVLRPARVAVSSGHESRCSAT